VIVSLRLISEQNRASDDEVQQGILIQLQSFHPHALPIEPQRSKLAGTFPALIGTRIELGQMRRVAAASFLASNCGSSRAGSECPLLAQSRHTQCADERPLLGVKRTLTNRCLPISIYEYTP
jgi:hypothetical protein